MAHKDKMEKELGYAPGPAESFMRTHSSLDEKGERKWVDQRSENTYKQFMERMNEFSSQGSNDEGEASQPNLQSQMQMWVEIVGGGSKGRIYGLGGEASFFKNASSSSRSSWNPYAQEQTNEELKGEIVGLKEQISTLTSEIQEYRTMFRGLKNYLPFPPGTSSSNPFMPPSYAPHLEKHASIPSSCRSRNQNEYENEDDEDEDDI